MQMVFSGRRPTLADFPVPAATRLLFAKPPRPRWPAANVGEAGRCQIVAGSHHVDGAWPCARPIGQALQMKLCRPEQCPKLGSSMPPAVTPSAQIRQAMARTALAFTVRPRCTP